MNKIYASLMLTLFICLNSCSDILDLSPRDKVSADVVLSSEEGVNMYLANLYYLLPVEDFGYMPRSGFRVSDNGIVAAMYSDEAVHSEFGEFGREGFDYWTSGYELIRKINTLIGQIPDIDVKTINNDELMGEALFLRAYTYFALVKRYGGLSVIDHVQEYTNDFEALKVPRSTEKETYDFILHDLDDAIIKLSTNITNSRRANKWVALAFKSRVALFAGSIAKYTHAPYLTLSGVAVDKKLVGIDAQYADEYFKQCIDASEEIVNSGKYGLYKPNPVNAQEAAVNYQKLFEDPNSVLDGVQEPIFIKGYTSGTDLTQNYDIWFRPNQLANTWPHPGRLNPVLDLVDVYEDYTDDGTGISRPIKSRVDNNESNYSGFNPSVNYNHFPKSSPEAIFNGKDARLFASLLLPGSTWKNTKIVIQGGLVRTDGSLLFRTHGSATGADGSVYYTFGSEKSDEYSGFATDQGNYTRTGFLFKKFLQETKEVQPEGGKGDNDWIEIRMGEVLLNYAEAIAEYTQATQAMRSAGSVALNAVRKRAAHTDDIPLTVNNVRKERRVELAFENKRYWDLIRWRTFHTEFNNRTRKALVPLLDLRQNPAQYIFVRMDVPSYGSLTYQYNLYYRMIPGTGDNGLIQNP